MGQLLPTAMAREERRCLKNTILALSVSSLQDYRHLGPSIEQAARNTNSRLLVILISPLFDPHNGINAINSWKEIEALISFVYMRASSVAISLDRVLMSIDVALHPGEGSSFSNIDGERSTGWEAIYVGENGTHKQGARHNVMKARHRRCRPRIASQMDLYDSSATAACRTLKRAFIHSLALGKLAPSTRCCSAGRHI